MTALSYLQLCLNKVAFCEIISSFATLGKPTHDRAIQGNDQNLPMGIKLEMRGDNMGENESRTSFPYAFPQSAVVVLTTILLKELRTLPIVVGASVSDLAFTSVPPLNVCQAETSG